MCSSFILAVMPMSSRISGGSNRWDVVELRRVVASQPLLLRQQKRGTGLLCMGMEGRIGEQIPGETLKNSACFHCLSSIVSILRLCACACFFVLLMSCKCINEYRVLRCFCNLYLETLNTVCVHARIIHRIFRLHIAPAFSL
jgi:hypothetical protein